MIADIEGVTPFFPLAEYLHILPLMTRLSGVVHDVHEQCLEQVRLHLHLGVLQRILSVSPSLLREGTVTAATLRIK
jgi:hypothetical protein